MWKVVDKKVDSRKQCESGWRFQDEVRFSLASREKRPRDISGSRHNPSRAWRDPVEFAISRARHIQRNHQHTHFAIKGIEAQMELPLGLD